MSPLADEERDDVRRRLDFTLHHPEGWARSRGYNERDPAVALEDLLSERSVRWVEDFEGPIWTASHGHPKAGPVTAGDLLTSWVAHDLIHIRQMTRLHRQYLGGVLSDHDPDYAGDG